MVAIAILTGSSGRRSAAVARVMLVVCVAIECTPPSALDGEAELGIASALLGRYKASIIWHLRHYYQCK